MTEVVLTNCAPNGDMLRAAFLPDRGMNLISFKRNSTEVIDQETRSLFDERSAGYGPLIGPHFHHRNPNTIPPVPDESKFPHIARIKAKGIKEPFSHGIARYAPWQVESTAIGVKAVLSGKHEWNGVALSKLEGQNFEMCFEAEMLPEGLRLKLSVVSEADSVVGLHYYYRLPGGKGIVSSEVQPEYRGSSGLKPIPESWGSGKARALQFDLSQDADYGFRPYPSTLNGEIELKTSEYTLRTEYRCPNAENSWQLFRPAGGTYVCIEPLSAMNPRKPRLTASSLEILLKIS